MAPAKAPLIAVHPMARDSPVWGQAFPSAHYSVSDDSNAPCSAVPSHVEKCRRLQAGWSMSPGPPLVFRHDPMPIFKLPNGLRDGVQSQCFMSEKAPQGWKPLGAPGYPNAYATGANCVSGRYTSGRSSILSIFPSDGAHTAAQPQFVKQTSLQGEAFPVVSRSSKASASMSFAESGGVDEVGTSSVRRVENPVVFSAFFDRMKLDHLVAAKDKILQSLAGSRSPQGTPQAQNSVEAPPLANIIPEVHHGPVSPTVQVLGGVDLGLLYTRYQKNNESSALTSDLDTTSASQASPAEPSPPTVSDADGDPNVGREKVFRTEAAARLAASPRSGNIATPASSGMGLRVVAWPKQTQRQNQSKSSKVSEQPEQIPNGSERRSCRIAYRRPGEAVNQFTHDLRRSVSPSSIISSIAMEGSYTHIIPVSKSGTLKGLFKGKVSARAARVGHQTAASVVEMNDFRFFVFNIPDRELIRSTEFQLFSCISQGSFGTVYKAKWRGQTVAVKQAHGKMTLEAMRSVAREFNSYRIIDHPYIVKYYGVCVEHNFVALVTEYLNGGNIFDMLFENKITVSAAVRLRMCKQLVDAVHFLHTKKRLVHRDLKTANLVVDGHYNLRLCDFGKTRSLEQHGKLKLEDNGGSPRYMAPECFVEGNYVDHKVDIWGLACCLIEILGGPIPFEEIHSNEGVIQELLYKKRRPMVPAWFHPSIRAALDQCFRWNANERPDTQRLKEVLSSVTAGDLNQYGMNSKRVQ